MPSILAPPSPWFFEALHPVVKVQRPESSKDIHRQLTYGGRFVALLGDNGSGKTYFIHHQLLPFYRGETPESEVPNSKDWRIATLTPGIDPTMALATALAAPNVLHDERNLQPFFRETLAEKLHKGGNALVDAYQEAVAVTGTDFKLLIVVDQVEEMFRLEDELATQDDTRFSGRTKYFNAGDNTIFFDLFAKALTEEVPIYVVFAISTNDINRLNRYPVWAERISLQRYPLWHIGTHALEKSLLRWPERSIPGNSNDPPELPEGAKKLYKAIAQDYFDLPATETEGIGKVNIALEYLGRRMPYHVAGPLMALDPRPGFLSELSPTARTSPKYGQTILGQLAEPALRDEWADYFSRNEAPKAFDDAVDTYFKNLKKEYDDAGGVDEIPDKFYDDIFDALSPEEQLLTERLFQTITVKDSSPNRVLESYAVSFGYLRDVCFREARNGSEIKALVPDVELPPGTNRERENECLRRIILRFNFYGEPLPGLVRWVSPDEVPGDQVPVFTDQTIIKPGNTAILQQWGKLAEWVEEEYASSIYYRKLVQDARDHFVEAVKPEGSLPAGLPEPINIPEPNWARDLWDALTGAVRSIASNNLITVRARKEKERSLLNPGRAELVEEWLRKKRPSAEWGRKYHPARVTREDEKTTNTGFNTWLNEKKIESFAMATAFWKKSKQFYEIALRNEENQLNYDIKTKGNTARLTSLFSVLAMSAFLAAGILAYYVNETKNNLELLDFVDTMTKANVIPNDIYRTSQFDSLRTSVVENDKINSKEAVVAYLARWGMLRFEGGDVTTEHGEISSKALVQLDELVGSLHSSKKKDINDLYKLTGSISGLAYSASSLNTNLQEVNYQYPYVYQLLWENVGALRLNQESAVKSFSPKDRGNVYNGPARINAVASNPEVKDQYAFGDATGKVVVMLSDSIKFERTGSAKEEISGMAYSVTGEELYVSTYAGTLFRYTNMKDPNNLNAPLGIKDNLPAQPLRINWKNKGNERAVTAVEITSDKNFLLLLTDVNVQLIRRTENTAKYDYELVDTVNLTNELASLTAIQGNPQGTKFIVGGSVASQLLSFSSQPPFLERIRTVVHPKLSVSAIAFQTPASASGGPAPQNDNPSIAIGTETGDIWLTDLNSFHISGDRQRELLEELDTRMVTTEPDTNFQQSAITSLIFNQTGNETTGNLQLISSSLDGTIWMFNLDVAPTGPNVFLQKGPDSGGWDHLRLVTTGQSINNACLVNADQLVLIENNTIRSWPTSFRLLHEELFGLLPALKK